MNTSNRNIGAGMLWLTAVLVLGLLTWFFRGQLERQFNPNREVRVLQQADETAIVLEPNRQGHYVLTGRINGREVGFLVDTGATEVALPGRLAHRLELPRLAETRFRTANGVSAGYLTRLETLELGPIRLHGVRAGVVPNLDGPALLGMSALQQLQISQRGRDLVLTQTTNSHE